MDQVVDVAALKQAESLLNARKPAETIAFLLDQPARLFILPQTQNLLALAYLRIGDTVSAIRTIELCRHFGASDISILKLHAAVYRVLKDWLRLDQTLETLVARSPADAPSRYQLAIRMLDSKRLQEAKNHARILAENGAHPDQLYDLTYRIALAEGDHSAALAAVRSLLHEGKKAPSLANLPDLLLQLCAKEREEIVCEVVQKWPSIAGPLKPCIGRGGIEAMVLRPDQDAFSLAMAGNTQAALAQIDSLDAAVYPDLYDLRQIIQMLPPQDGLRRPLIEDDGANVIVSAPGETGVTLLVFTGLADRVGLPIAVLDAFCAEAGHSAVYLRDCRRELFLSGVSELGANPQETTLAIQVLLEDLGTRTLLCLGNSAGGFAAIRYGLRLGASRILCSSVASNINDDFLEAIDDRRGRLVSKRLNAAALEDGLDISSDILDGNGQCAIDLWYGELSREDVAHAAYLEGLPGVSCYPIPQFPRHNTSIRLIASGAFQEFMSKAEWA